MTFPTIPNPREQDHVIMDILFVSDLGPDIIKSSSRCRGAMRAIFLLDLSTADGKYLKHFVFNPGMATAGSMYIFPRGNSTRDYWDHWFDFWHSYTTTGGKLKVPLGKWSNPTHWVWQWFYKKEDSNPKQVEGGRAVHFRPARRLRLTRSKVVYQQVHDKEYNSQMLLGCPTSVRAILLTKVNKLQEGPSFANATKEYTNFWDFIQSWGGNWMWDDIDFAQETTQDLKWVSEGMQNNTLVWTTDGS
jgi:hypothetical protein